MPKTRSTFICSNCGKRSPTPYKLCPQCRQFGTMVEHIEQASQAPRKRRQPTSDGPAAPQSLVEIDLSQETRIPVPIEEFSRVLGGGFVPGSLVLLGGEPGIGKSTLALDLSAQLARSGYPVLYASGEESARQIKMRAERLEADAADLFVLAETDLEAVIEQVRSLDPQLLVVDSIQTTRSAALDSTPGMPAQVRECTLQLQELAKTKGLSILMIGHVTKDGNIAGPRVLEHIVDAVLYLEGDPFQQYRLLRGVKNRFGATSEVGVFEMRGSGLIEVRNPSEALLEERVINAPGSAVSITLEGTRPLLVELQALTSLSPFANPRRTANGVDMRRMLLVSAVLSARLGLKLVDQDIFVNVIGGLKISEPASDLALALAVASSFYDRPLPADLAVVGEVGLSGEVRRVGQLAARLNEAKKIGFKRVLVPRLRRHSEALPAGIEAIEARSVGDALRLALPE